MVLIPRLSQIDHIQYHFICIQGNVVNTIYYCCYLLLIIQLVTYLSFPFLIVHFFSIDTYCY